MIRMPLATLEKELQLSRHEVETLIEAINSTMEESKKIERDLISIQVNTITQICLMQKGWIHARGSKNTVNLNQFKCGCKCMKQDIFCSNTNIKFILGEKVGW